MHFKGFLKSFFSQEYCHIYKNIPFSLNLLYHGMIYGNMSNEDYHLKLQLAKSLFKGREDVFAIRWEKDGKSGYMPAYQYDPYLYRLHRMKGGSFKDYKDKSHRFGDPTTIDR